MSLADLSELAAALGQTLSTAKESRQAGEAYLQAARHRPNFLVSLASLCAEPSVEESVRTAALICLKNEISKHWRHEGETAISVPKHSEADRQACRNMVLQLSAAIPPTRVAERRLIDEAIYHILLNDFPEKWPELNGAIVRLCQNRSEMTNVIAGLNVLVKMGRKYDLSRAEVATEAIGDLLAQCCPLLFDLVASIGPDRLFATADTAYFTKQFCKLYYVVSYSMRSTAYFQQSFDHWMKLIAVVLQTQIPVEMLATTSILDQNFAVKAKKWALYSIRTSIIRYCTPRHVKNADTEPLPQARAFQERHALPFIQLCIDLLCTTMQAQQHGNSPGLSTATGRAVGSTAPDGSVVQFIMNDVHLSVVLDALGQTLEFAGGYKLLKPHIQAIIVNLCHPLLCYNDQDIEDRELDPSEYARNNATGMYMRSYDIGANPAHAAGGFLANVMRLRSKDFLAATTTFIQNEFEKYAALDQSQRGIGSEATRRKFGALKMLAEVAPRLTCKKRNLEMVIEDFLYTHVAPELQSTDPWLRGCAASVLASMFRTWELPIVKPERLIEVLVQILRNCRDEDCTVRLETLRALAVLVTLENDIVKAFISQHARDVCELLVGMTDDLNISESAVTALTELCESFPDEILCVAPGVMQKLVSTFAAMVQAMQTQSSAKALSNAEGEQLEFTMNSVVQTLVSVCCVLARDKACGKHMETVAPILQPFLDYAISGEGEEFLEDAVQCLALVTYDIPSIPLSYWKYYDVMYQAVCGGAKPYPPTEINADGAWGLCELPSFVGALDNYLQRGREVFVSQVSPLTGLSYKEEYFRMIKQGFSSLDANMDNPAAGLMMVWLLVDAFSASLSPELVELALDFCEEYLAVQKAQENTIPRMGKEQLVRIYATLIASSCAVAAEDIISAYDQNKTSQIMAALAARRVFSVEEWLKLAVDPKMVTMIETKKMIISAFTVIVERLCSGAETIESIKQCGEKIISVLAHQCISISRAREREKALEDADSEWDANSEQELEENDDAAPNYLPLAVLEKLREKGLLEEDDDDNDEDDDFVDGQLTDFGERRSVFDTTCEYVSALNSISRHSEVYAKVLGSEDMQKLIEHLQKEIAAKSTATAF